MTIAALASLPASIAPAVPAGAVCFAAGLVLGPFALRAAEWVRPRRNVFFARWGFSHVVLAAIAAVVGGVLVAHFAPEPFDTRLAQPVALLLACALALRAAQRTETSGWRALGLASAGTWRDHAAALLLLALSAPALLGAGLLWPAVVAPDERTWSDLAVAAHGGDALALVLLLLVLPVMHELFFRGFLLPLSAQNFSEKGGLVVVAAIGGALAGPAAFLPQLVLGVAAGTLRLRTQAVLPCVVLHAAYNGAALLVGPGGAGGDHWVPL